MKKGALGHLLSPFGITQLVMIAAIGAALWLAYEPWRWGKVRESIRRRNAEAGQIDGRTLDNWLANPAHTKPLLIDVRTPGEFETSHLADARSISPANIPGGLGNGVRAESPIVVYCAIGQDSASVVSSLKRRGYERVQYLEGGIFLWANERRPLVNAAGPTTKVAPGQSPYADLLKREFRAR